MQAKPLGRSTRGQPAEEHVGEQDHRHAERQGGHHPELSSETHGEHRGPADDGNVGQTRVIAKPLEHTVKIPARV